jgi:hypothetical protein
MRYKDKIRGVTVGVDVERIGRIYVLKCVFLCGYGMLEPEYTLYAHL